MTDMLTQLVDGVGAASLRRAEVVDITESGTVIVLFHGASGDPIRCEMLVTTDGAPPAALAPGDAVLVWLPADATPAVVVGRIGPSRGLTADADATPDTLTIEARHELTLRVGDGSITIRADGRVLIKGKDLVSHAQRTNRIRGGSVAIN